MMLHQRRLVSLSKNILKGCHRCSSTIVVKSSHENISSEKSTEKRFVPMTRKTLIRKITENTHLVAPADQEEFVDFVKGLESSVSHDFNTTLRELKVNIYTYILYFLLIVLVLLKLNYEVFKILNT